MNLAPLMFISHGSPMFAFDTSLPAQQLANQSKHFDHVQAIVVISAHWLTRGNYITSSEKSEVIYDFIGFPQTLYELQYPASGAPMIANKIMNLLDNNGIKCKNDSVRGWDHGVWIPLRHLRPNADKPIIQISINVDYDTHQLQQFGHVLKQLRSQNIGIICSGSVTHNLGHIRAGHDVVADYAQHFQLWVREAIVNKDIEALKHPNQSRFYQHAHPSSEHYLPLVVALAASDEHESVNVLTSPILYHTISMESYIWTG